MRIRKRWLLVGLAVFLVATPLIAAQQRLIPTSYPYAICETCHAKEGYLPVELVPVVPPEVPPDKAFNVTLFIVNPWEHQVRKIDGALNISLAAENINFLAGGSTDTWNETGNFTGRQAENIQTSTRPGLTTYAIDFAGAAGPDGQNRWQVTLTDPNNVEIDSCTARGPAPQDVGNGSAPACSIDLTPANISQVTTGDWTVEVRLVDTKTVPGVTEPQRWWMNASARYVVEMENHKNFQNTPTIRDVGPFGQEQITWRVRSAGQGDYTLQFAAEVELYHNHDTFSGSDSDFVTAETQMKATVGDEFVPAETEVGGLKISNDPTAFMRSWGKVTGFASVLMILPSFLFVGVFSKHNKYAMNRFFGSARNRVVWHAAVSWIIILLALVHTVLFLMEPRFDEFDFVDFKFVTGWVALGFMFGLGVTGLWQIPFTKRMGYKWWRWLHMYMGIAAFALSIFHTIYDGEDFAWLNPVETSRTVNIVLTGAGSWLAEGATLLGGVLPGWLF